MHPALRLEEILLNIFGQCYSPIPTSKQRVSRATADLAALARTCRTFKEPALDVLWTELVNLSPLARCLPQASHRIYPGYPWYSFSRPLEQAEWDILRSYTRRVRSVLDFTRGLNWDSVKILFNPPSPDPMFPNLRILRWEFLSETFPLMHHLAVSSLTSLEIDFVFGDLPPFHSFPLLLGDLCPNMRRFKLRMRRPQIGSDDAISNLICHWTNLQVLYCPYVSLDIDSLLHLSHTPSLTSLSFSLNGIIVDQIISSRSTLCFSGLRDLEISSQSLDSISRLLPHIRLPSVESFTVYIDSCFSKYTLKSYLTAVQKVCTQNTLSSLRVVQTRSSSTNHDSERCQLTIEDMRPCMSFGQLRRVDINTAWTVNLTDNDLLEMASAWPHLEHLLINEEWGWGTEGGVTPAGLLQILERLEELRHLCLAVDTRGYAAVPQHRIFDASRIFEQTRRVPFYVNVADSAIQPESVDALAGFFGGIMQHANMLSCYWRTPTMGYRLDSEISKRLWEEVFMKAHEKVRVQSLSPLTGKTPTFAERGQDRGCATVSCEQRVRLI